MAIRRHKCDYAGVYQLRNKVNGKKYVGSSVRMWKRFLNHRSSLKINSKTNYFLQKDWDKYGDVLSFKVLEFCDSDKLLEREQYWMDKLNPEYNISKNSKSCKGVKRRSETIAKFIGRKMSVETRNKIAAARKGKPGNRKGKKASKETIEKIRIAQTGKKYSDEVNIKKGRKGELHSWWGKGKSVVQYTMSGEYIKEFTSACQAARFLGHEGQGSNILKCCDKKIPTSYGFKWQYKIQY